MLLGYSKLNKFGPIGCWVALKLNSYGVSLLIQEVYYSPTCSISNFSTNTVKSASKVANWENARKFCMRLKNRWRRIRANMKIGLR